MLYVFSFYILVSWGWEVIEVEISRNNWFYVYSDTGYLATTMSMNLKKSASNTREQYEEQSKKVLSISQHLFELMTTEWQMLSM